MIAKSQISLNDRRNSTINNLNLVCWLPSRFLHVSFYRSSKETHIAVNHYKFDYEYIHTYVILNPSQNDINVVFVYYDGIYMYINIFINAHNMFFILTKREIIAVN